MRNTNGQLGFCIAGSGVDEKHQRPIGIRLSWLWSDVRNTNGRLGLCIADGGVDEKHKRLIRDSV